MRLVYEGRTGAGAVLIAAFAVGGGLATATADDGATGREKTAEPPAEVTHHEVPGGAYVPVPREGQATTPAFRGVRNGFVSVQVNVDGQGRNLVGDAANEPSIAVDPHNSLRTAIGWRQFDTIQSNFRQAGWGYTRDGGRSWTFPGVIDPGVFRSDPVLDTDADGNFFYNSLTLDGGDFLCTVYMSVDGGMTWDEGVFAWGGDKQWMVIDRTDGIGRHNIYANWTRFFSVCNGQFTRSYDGGDSYLSCIDVPNEPQWGTLAIGPAGELYIAGADAFVVKSSTLQDPDLPPDFDFVRPVDLGGDTVFGGGPNPGGLLGQTWVATDVSDGPTRGNVYMLSSVDPPGSDPLDVQFSRSTDGGLTWSDAVRVNDVRTGWQWFGTMSVAPNGRIDVVWNDTRNHPGDVISELFYAFSEDAGVTWSANVALSPSFDPHVGWPDQSKIGDYYDMVSDRVGAHVAYSATFNGEQDVYYLRVNDYDCNDNGVGDTLDISEGGSDDVNGNEIPDECECLADLDGSGVVDFADVLAILGAWGPCEGCPEDIDGSGVVDFAEILLVLGGWGPCP